MVYIYIYALHRISFRRHGKLRFSGGMEREREKKVYIYIPEIRAHEREYGRTKLANEWK